MTCLMQLCENAIMQPGAADLKCRKGALPFNLHSMSKTVFFLCGLY